MARISSTNLSVDKFSSAGHAYVDYSYTIDWAGNDRKEDLYHLVHVFLWERDGSNKDWLHTRYNGTRAQVWRDSGNDEYIAHINSRWLHPDGDAQTSVSDSKQLMPGTASDEWGQEEFYLQVGLHPNAGGNAEAYSNVDQEKF